MGITVSQTTYGEEESKRAHQEEAQARARKRELVKEGEGVTEEERGVREDEQK